MRVRIHRGANEIGGNCIELAARERRLVLDIGWPITAARGVDVPLPDVAGLRGDDPALLGIVISHPHPDHYGLLPKVSSTVPVYIGEAAANMLRAAVLFSPGAIDLSPAGFLAHRAPFEIGPFRITPYLNDHSAFDAYSMLIEADGRRVFYTGDIRGHGRKAGLFEELIEHPPTDVDVLLMEGTHVRADSSGTERGLSESDVENACVETLRSTEGMALLLFSPQNIDRLVTMFRACLRSGRDLVIDLYAAAVLQATGSSNIPRADWDRVRIYLPKSQKARVVRERAFALTDSVKADRIYADELNARRSQLAIIFRASMAAELLEADCLGGATAIYSMWPGYLRNAQGATLARLLERQQIPIVIHHASGHAFIPDLQRLAAALNPKRLVPIHSFAGDHFEEFFPNVDRQPDGTWWDV